MNVFLASSSLRRWLFGPWVFCLVLAGRADDPKEKTAKSPSAQGANAPRSEIIASDHAAKMTRGLEVFKNHVQPILAKSCVRCHGGKKTEGELDLSEREGLLRGGGRGPAVLPGNAKDSLLYKLVMHARDPHMPRSSPKLSDEAINQIALWIDLGAPYDQPLVAKSKTDEKAWTRKTVSEEDRQFWSFQPLRRLTPPAQIQNEKWCQTSIDRFILAKMESAGISPNSRAEKEQLIRRVYFDLIGLPPSLDDIRQFMSDPAPDAYERLVDRLLDNQHFGERWARHWLDLARFAESHGFEHDYDRPTAYHYRDFVIEALNQDLPYDKFVKWQIAGDEYEPDNHLAVKATGFLAAGVHSTQITKSEVEKHRYDEMDDKLNTVSTAFLGLSVGCARCHDHKYDPIPQRDYYRMLATFTTTVRSEVEVKPVPSEYAKAKAAHDLKHKPLVDQAELFTKEK